MDAPSRKRKSMRIRGTCSVSGCRAPHKAHGMCTKHYMRWRKHGDPQVVLTTTGGRRSAGFERFLADLDQAQKLYESGVFATTLAQRYGISHETVTKYLRQRGVQIRPRGHGIDGPTKRLLTHAQNKEIARLYEEGQTSYQLASQFAVSRGTITATLRRQGAVRPRLPVRSPDGYVKVWVPLDNPFAAMKVKPDGRVLEHRLVMAQHLGRSLLPTETVHHKNGIRDDNRLENLELRQGKHGNGQAWQCADCGSRNLVAI